MEIKNIKINSYGKLKDKKIELNKFNIIYGKNESGKSTLLNFITNMFYGISKNKNGKSISDFDKYLPWSEADFSGKIEYELDNNTIYSIFRDFNKKNPEVYDQNNEDISKQFFIDKREGNQFFYEQTKIDRDTLNSTVISNQKEVEIDNQEQGQLIQKIANLAESGDEELSYKKAITKLDKMLLNEVGTDKSQDRPINIAKENVTMYENKISEIKNYEKFKYTYEEERNKINNEITEEENNKIIYTKIKNVLNNNKIEEEKIKIKNKIIEENENKIKKNTIEKSRLEKNKNKKINLIILSIIILINIASIIFIKNNIVKSLIFLTIPTFIIYIIVNNKKNNSNYINTQIKILKKNNEDLLNEVQVLKQNLLENNKMQKEQLINLYGPNINDLFNSSINIIMDTNMETLNNLKLRLHKLELDRNNIEPKIEELATNEENLEIERKKLEDLNNKAYIYKSAKEILQSAYEEMKKNVTPKFSNSLSEKINKFSDGAYNNIALNNGISVELNNGQYISIDQLSIGTIEQIYLALRLSVVDELSTEKLPIMLDEAFAYYDDNRLSSSLSTLTKLDNQVIIFTCTNREKEILDKLGVKYNFIEL